MQPCPTHCACANDMSIRPIQVEVTLYLSLDKENLSNYRPISNLSFLSKLTERNVLARINEYLSSNSLLNPHQSGFTKHHSTETLLVYFYNKLVSAVSHQQVSCLCLLPRHICCI